MAKEKDKNLTPREGHLGIPGAISTGFLQPIESTGTDRGEFNQGTIELMGPPNRNHARDDALMILDEGFCAKEIARKVNKTPFSYLTTVICRAGAPLC